MEGKEQLKLLLNINELCPHHASSRGVTSSMFNMLDAIVVLQVDKDLLTNIRICLTNVCSKFNISIQGNNKLPMSLATSLTSCPFLLLAPPLDACLKYSSRFLMEDPETGSYVTTTFLMGETPVFVEGAPLLETEHTSSMIPLTILSLACPM